MRSILFKITLMCFLIVTVFARVGDSIAAHGVLGIPENQTQSTVEHTSFSQDFVGNDTCACDEMPGSKISLSCGVVLALPSESLNLSAPTSEADKWLVSSRSGLKLFLPVRKKPPRDNSQI